MKRLVSLSKLESSRTWHQRSYQIALKQGNQNLQNNMIASFCFVSTVHVTQWSCYLTQRAEILTRRSNLTPQRAKNTVSDLSVVSVVPWSRFGHKASWLHSFVSFFFRDQQAAVDSLLRKEVIFANTSPLLNTLKKKIISWSRTWSISWHLHSRIGKMAHIIEQPNT